MDWGLTGFASLGFGDDAAEVGDAGGDGADGDEVGLGLGGDDAGEGGFAAAGRAPEDEGGELAGFDEASEEFAGADEVVLADVFVEVAGAHAGGEGCAGLGLEGGDAFGIVHRAPTPAFADMVPFVVAQVELEDGARIPTNIVIDNPTPDNVKVGMAVEVVFDDVTENITLPKFKPA